MSFYMDPADPATVRTQPSAGMVEITKVDDLIAKIDSTHFTGAMSKYAPDVSVKGKKRSEVAPILYNAIVDALHGANKKQETEAVQTEPAEETVTEDYKPVEQTGAQRVAPEQSESAARMPKARMPKARMPKATASIGESSGPSMRTMGDFLNTQFSGILGFADECGFHWVIGRNEDGDAVPEFVKK
jgi:hypothetical protein